MTALPSASCSSSGIVPNERFPSTTRVFSSPVQHQLDLVAARFRQLDDAQPVGRNRPRRLAAPHSARAVRARDLVFDRVRKRRQVTVAFLDQQRTVLEPDETRGVSGRIRCLGCGDCVVLPLARNAVDAGLRNDSGEQRHGGPLHETTLLGKPLVQRLTPEEAHYPDGSIKP